MKTRIRDVREDNDFTQKQITEYLMCDQSLYSKYEREERAIPLLLVIKLAIYYNKCRFSSWITDSKEPYPRAK